MQVTEEEAMVEEAMVEVGGQQQLSVFRLIYLEKRNKFWEPQSIKSSSVFS